MGPGWVGDAGWHQVPELLKEGLSRLENALPFVAGHVVGWERMKDGRAMDTGGDSKIICHYCSSTW